MLARDAPPHAVHRRLLVNRTPALVRFAALLGGAACTGPALHLDNPCGHRVFVDGVAVARPTLPFRYYGTTRWDALPADSGNRTDFSHQPTSKLVPLPPPAAGWLFPLDFPIELLSRLLHGRCDTTTTIAVTPTPAAERAEPDSAAAHADALLERAKLARISR